MIALGYSSAEAASSILAQDFMVSVMTMQLSQVVPGLTHRAWHTLYLFFLFFNGGRSVQETGVRSLPGKVWTYSCDPHLQRW